MNNKKLMPIIKCLKNARQAGEHLSWLEAQA